MMMAEAAKTTGKRGRPSQGPAPMDFSGLTPTKVNTPVRETTGIKPENNPAVGWLEKSWAKQTQLNSSGTNPTYIGEGQALDVPAEQAANLEKLIRAASDYLRLGVTIPKPLQKIAGGKVRVVFAAKTRKAPPKPKASETPAVSPEAQPQQ